LGDVLSQEEIEKMLSAAGQIDEEPAVDADADAGDVVDGADANGAGAAVDAAMSDVAADGPNAFNTDEYLSKDEVDVLGEIANMCMGTSATTMSTLLSKRVTITTPRVSIQNLEMLSNEYPAPLIVAEVSYIEGITGDNLLILKEYDVALITNVLLGESTDIEPGEVDLTEIHMSAMNEVMNQMVGSSATSLADILNRMINISTPTTKRLELKDDLTVCSFADRKEPFVKISFKMEIEDLLSSEIMQIMPLQLAKDMVSDVMGDMESPEPAPAASPEPAAAPVAESPAPQQPQATAAAAVCGDAARPICCTTTAIPTGIWLSGAAAGIWLSPAGSAP